MNPTAFRTMSLYVVPADSPSTFTGGSFRIDSAAGRSVSDIAMMITVPSAMPMPNSVSTLTSFVVSVRKLTNVASPVRSTVLTM